ncbi:MULTISPECIES: hypothetical protein [unclassified Frankia]|uniref:hypothetical protein n=1 Tax=unclassified Frankia TaxID=2632575 RepID=UPI001EF74D94|nr:MULTISPECIES: hypothetical protein [unclassified Frankia]
MPEPVDADTSPGVSRDVRRADEVLKLAGQLRDTAAAFLDDLDRAIREIRTEGGDAHG